jgi:hypothetical protein
MEATCSSEMSVHFQRTTRRYIPDDRTNYSPSVVFSHLCAENVIFSTGKYWMHIKFSELNEFFSYLLLYHA